MFCVATVSSCLWRLLQCVCFAVSCDCAGADLQAAAGNVGNSLPQGARGFLGYVTTHINSPQVSSALQAGVCQHASAFACRSYGHACHA
jgi:hypothetical protein